jgi:hypothetical protein
MLRELGEAWEATNSSPPATLPQQESLISAATRPDKSRRPLSQISNLSYVFYTLPAPLQTENPPATRLPEAASGRQRSARAAEALSPPKLV